MLHAELITAQQKNDLKQVWRTMRLLARTRLGPKKRRYDMIAPETPELEQWISHLEQEGPAGDEGRGDEVPDPEDPSEEMGMCCEEVPSVLMLGEKRHDSRVPGHPGKYEVCELFSPQRVSAAASKQGLRGGWSLGIEMKDPVTGYLWDLTEPQAQSKVWRVLRRDKPLVAGLLPPTHVIQRSQESHEKVTSPSTSLRRRWPV